MGELPQHRVAPSQGEEHRSKVFSPSPAMGMQGNPSPPVPAELPRPVCIPYFCHRLAQAASLLPFAAAGLAAPDTARVPAVGLLAGRLVSPPAPGIDAGFRER